MSEEFLCVCICQLSELPVSQIPLYIHLLTQNRSTKVPHAFFWELFWSYVFSNMTWVDGICSLSHVRLFATLSNVAWEALLSMKFSKQEYWNGLPFSTSGDLPNPGIEPTFPAPSALAGRFFATVPWRVEGWDLKGALCKQNEFSWRVIWDQSTEGHAMVKSMVRTCFTLAKLLNLSGSEFPDL